MPYRGHCICGSIQVSLKEQPPSSLRCSSINYLVDEPEFTVEDARSLKTFKDTQSASGNVVARQFCGNCGSPVVTRSPKYPGKAFVKASLFEVISPPTMEVFTDRRQEWEMSVEGAKQA
ncbi:Mss4-like protein [Aspergillus recurvatus]